MKRFTFLSFVVQLLIISVYLTTFTVSAQITAPLDQERSYLIGPGDVVEVKVMGEPESSFTAIIDDEGKIQVPFYDVRLDAKCRSEKELKADVVKLMSKYLRNPLVSLRVTERKSRPPVSVVGEVKQPQGVILVRPTRLLEILAFVGSTTEDAGGSVEVFHTRGVMCPGKDDPIADDDPNVPSRLYSLSSMKTGKDEANPFIYPGDVVNVQRASPVYVTGEVRAPQGIRLSENGTSLSQAIAMVGGKTNEAKTSDIKIYRVKPDNTAREVIVADLKMIKAGTQQDPMLEPYDIVEVGKTKKSIAQTILEIAIGAGKGGITSVTNGLGYRVMY